MRRVLLLILLLLPGCASLVRLPAPPAEVVPSLPVTGIPNGRFWPDGDVGAMQAEARLAASRRGPGREGHFLALSGGGDNGAFGAGLMQGWTERGDRPEFDVVTGISAGALIAPFAFLGPAYDARLREVFTEQRPTDLIAFRRLPIAILFGEALADTSPLYKLIARQADEEMLAAIAREYRRGRLLLIGTTNLDLQRPVVWNIGAIADSGHPLALALFRRILLASASIPGAFPPVMIPVEWDGRGWQEMHVDGGAATQVFLYPPDFDGRSDRPRTVHVVRNGRLEVEADSTRLGIFSIARRSAATLLHFAGLGDINRIALLAHRDGLAFRLARIDPSFQHPRPEAFDTEYMRALFEHGRHQGLRGDAWISRPGRPAQP